MNIPVESQHPYIRGSRAGYTWSARFAFDHPRSLEDVVLNKVGNLQEHHEPGVIIEGSASNLEPVLRVAADMSQERLVPEITNVETQVYFQGQG